MSPPALSAPSPSHYFPSNPVPYQNGYHDHVCWTFHLNPARVRSYVSSPLASNGASRPQRTRPNAPAFPTSRPLRPFPSIANTLSTPPHRTGSAGAKKAVKLIEPPANIKCAFVLNLTQAEFSRQD